MASYSDDFDRANGEIGATWIEDAGDIDIVSNVAESQSAGIQNELRYNGQLDSVNHEVEADLGGKASTNCGAVTGRQISSTRTFYLGDYVEESVADGYRLRKRVAGSLSDLDTAASSSGQLTFKLIVNGAAQEVYVGGVLKCSDTDGTITTGLYPGMAMYSNNGGRANNWSAADLAAGAGAPTGALDGPFTGPLGGPI